MRDLYKAELLYGDFLVGEFIEKLKNSKKYEDSIIIITSDHGEFFGEHGELNHGSTVFNEVIRVPFIIKFPKNTVKPERISKLCSHYDLVPSVLNFLDIETDETLLDGQDIFKEDSSRFLVIDAPPLVLPQRLSHYPKIIQKYSFFWRSLINKDYKYIWKSDGSRYLFNRLDYEKDENNNIDNLKDISNSMHDQMLSFYKSIDKNFDIKEYPINIGHTAAQFITSPRIIRELKKEGYL